MRIIELEITNVRGIPHIVLKPNGKNFVIWGPNGSGKSAVVDAVDFLLTGRISRLMGEGTGGIILSKHGPHIGCDPEDAQVRAIIEVPGLDKPIEIKRCLARPTVLECAKEMKPHLEPILQVARRGQHVLTRREILRYITSDAGTRSQQIQELLNISDVEEIRKAFVKVQNDATKDVSAAKTAVAEAKGRINATLQRSSYDADHLLAVVNHCRSILGGQPLSTISAASLKDALPPAPTRVQNAAVNPTLIEKDNENLLRCLDPEFQESITANDNALRALLVDVRTNAELLKALEQAELTRLGLNLVDDSGQCPLCDTPWNPSHLRTHLEQKMIRADKAREYQDKISASVSKLVQSLTFIVSSLERTVTATRVVGDQADLDSLENWLASLKSLAEELGAVVDKYPNSQRLEVW